jgi:hypothetical protein
MIDELRARAVLRRIEDDPLAWDQRYYAAYGDGRVRYCYAGHAAILAGDPPILPTSLRPYPIVTISGRLIPTVAAEWLALRDVDNFNFLFAATNTLEQLGRIVDDLTLARVA